MTSLLALITAVVAGQLLALPAIAQTGSATSSTSNSSATTPGGGYGRGILGTRGPADCSKTADPQQCAARKAAHRKVFAACREHTGLARAQCMQLQAQQIDCTQARKPAQCEERKTAYALCTGRTGPQFRNCVLQKTLPADCSRATDVTLCQRQDKARKRCAAKSGAEHRQCVLDILTPAQ